LGGAVAGTLATLPGLAALAESKTPGLWKADGGYGPLRPLQDETTGLYLLELPEGFRYFSMGWTGTPMQDGRNTPARHDGMAVVKNDGKLITLIRNHEIVNDRGSMGPSDVTYDPAAGGGTTTFEFDVAEGRLVKTWTSLAGTLQNCCGGPTPWGSWLSCEEALIDPGFVFNDGGQRRQVRFQEKHGFVFEVPAEGKTSARPLVDMGQFFHEAVAVDPRDGIVYETEDRDPVCGFYRFIPGEPGKLAAGGRLQMMKVKGLADMRRHVPLNQPQDVSWVDIPDPAMGHSPGTQDSSGVIRQGLAAGGSQFTRLEGCWYDNGQIHFSSTSGGYAERGQIFRFDPYNQTVTLVYESSDNMELEFPDNVTISPNGCVLICEDGSRTGQMLMGLSQQGEMFPVARNTVELAGEHLGFSGDFRTSEWCGACFSPDGRWLFANIQKPGITLAITGPWGMGRI
jgi:secreted PhoX family phosphatase